MSDKKGQFHEFSLHSFLFKGRTDWYFCYLKTEKIAHVLAVLSERVAPEHYEQLSMLADSAATLPGDIAHLAAGEIDAPFVLADVFSMISGVRLAGTREVISKENAAILCDEYEQVARKLVAGSHPSPFVSAEDFMLPELPQREEAGPVLSLPEVREAPKTIKDISKGHVKKQGSSQETDAKGRMAVILQYIRKNKSVSIKDISLVVRDCSEKTIQRDLTVLIQQGLVRKVGERRWSVYVPA